MSEFDDTGQPMIDIARGDVHTSRRIRNNLEILQEKSREPEFQRLIQDVLDGRRPLREAMRNPVFDAEMTPHIDTFNEKWEEVMSEDQEVVGEQEVREFKRLQGEVKRKMDEITQNLQKLQEYKDDLEADG
jgi:hypothetical protein